MEDRSSSDRYTKFKIPQLETRVEFNDLREGLTACSIDFVPSTGRGPFLTVRTMCVLICYVSEFLLFTQTFYWLVWTLDSVGFSDVCEMVKSRFQSVDVTEIPLY